MASYLEIRNEAERSRDTTADRMRQEEQLLDRKYRDLLSRVDPRLRAELKEIADAFIGSQWIFSPDHKLECGEEGGYQYHWRLRSFCEKPAVGVEVDLCYRGGKHELNIGCNFGIPQAAIGKLNELIQRLNVEAMN